MQSRYVRSNGHQLVQTLDDANMDIASATLNWLLKDSQLWIIANDTDVLMVSMYLWNPEMVDIYIYMHF